MPVRSLPVPDALIDSIRETMRRHKLTESQLADMCGFHPSTLHNVIEGRYGGRLVKAKQETIKKVISTLGQSHTMTVAPPLFPSAPATEKDLLRDILAELKAIRLILQRQGTDA